MKALRLCGPCITHLGVLTEQASTVKRELLHQAQQMQSLQLRVQTAEAAAAEQTMDYSRQIAARAPPHPARNRARSVFRVSCWLVRFS